MHPCCISLVSLAVLSGIFFCADERMAQLASAGDPYPTIVTIAISSILAVWGLYAWSGAGLIVKLPLLKTCLVLITAVYLVRGVVGLFAPFFTSDPVVHQNSMTFWAVSSVICCVYGIYYLLGTKKLWRET
ncbi:MAG: putative oxidoreductase [Glaciecola sp.]